MRKRPDLVDEDAPPGLEVLQLTDEPDVPASHVYMEAQVFTPDSRRFLLHRSAHAHGASKDDPQHRYLVCDIAEDCRFTPLTTETGATAPSVTPDGRTVYYFVDETVLGGGRLILKRVGLDGTRRETVLVIDSPLAGTGARPSRVYPLSTISSDGRRLALSAFLGDGVTENAPWGLMVFDLAAGSVRLVLEGVTWCNMHPQYCRSPEGEQSHDILVQENHGNACDREGKILRLTGGEGADIHVIRDDGTSFRDLPWGRDGNEFCQGHQCWRGQTAWAITSTDTRQPAAFQLIESRPAPHAGHVGIRTPGGGRNDLTRGFARPWFCHFATDQAGRRLVSDAGAGYRCRDLYLADLAAPGTGPLANWRRLLDTRGSGGKEAHIHPFLSPDGTMAFFNSDESGILQAYLVRGFD